MVRDPVCGTFVVPERAVSLTRRARHRVLLFSGLPRRLSHATIRALRPCRRANGMTTESSLRADIVEVGRRMYARGYTASNDGNISVRLGHRSPADDAEERLQGLHDARHDVHHRSRGPEAAGRSRSLVGDADAPRGLPAAARRAGGRPRASADRDRLCRRRHSARSRRARRSADDARQHSDRRIRDAVDEASCPKPCGSTSRRTTACCSRITAR